MNDSIALIIAYYNGSEFVEAALLSAFNQIIPFDEIIVVNDGSNEDESLVIEELCLKYKKYPVQYYKKQNGGQGSARNFGCYKSNSRYISFLDQDDILLPEHNNVLLNEFKKSSFVNYGVVYANFATVQSDGRCISRNSRPSIDVDTIPTIYTITRQDIFILPSACMIDKEAFVSVAGFDEQFKGYEDDDLFIRIFRAGFRFSFVNEEVYMWRMHKNQTSSSHKMLRSRIKFIEKWYDNGYESSINVNLIRVGLYNRFKKIVLKDRLDANTKQDRDLAKENILYYLKRFQGIYSIEGRIVLLLFYRLPVPVLRVLVSFFKRIA